MKCGETEKHEHTQTHKFKRPVDLFILIPIVTTVLTFFSTLSPIKKCKRTRWKRAAIRQHCERLISEKHKCPNKIGFCRIYYSISFRWTKKDFLSFAFKPISEKLGERRNFESKVFFSPFKKDTFIFQSQLNIRSKADLYLKKKKSNTLPRMSQKQLISIRHD